MVIAVNTRLLIHDRLEGIGRFAHETLRILTRDHPEHQFIFIFDRKFSDEFVYSDNVLPVTGFPQARHPLLWYAFFEMMVPAIINKHKAGLFLSPDGWLSLRSDVKSLPVIHDLNFFHLPGYIPWHIRQYYQYFFPKFVSKANRIATVSSFSKRDIVSLFHYDPGKIDVVYNGANECFKPVTEEVRHLIREKYTRSCPFFLSVGLIHPRKNVTGLIKAFDGFRKSSESNVKLLIVGSKKWWTNDMQSALDAAAFRDEIIFTGRLPDEDLRMITASALALVYVSHFEGFGIPMLEAMYCDTPVVASKITALTEVGGDAVLYADPSSVESIKAAMLSMYRNSDLRLNLVEKARIQRAQFSWKRTSELLWESIVKCSGLQG
ncbi:MAG: glycosyltransferase family 4 protein [Bacteroidales bacterium]|nr:glycosyltransferase family 4 protein [Bacteroidales bacterium]